MIFFVSVFAQESSFEFVVESKDFVLKKKLEELLNTQKEFGESVENDLIKNFVLMNDLENIIVTREIEGAKTILHFDIIPRYKVDTITFKGNTFFNDVTLRGMVTVKRFTPINEIDSEKEIKSIVDAYKKKGYLTTKVEIQKIFTNESNAVSLIFDITEGERVNIQKISLRGFEKYNEEKIKKRLELKEGDFYESDTLLTSQENIKELLLKEGFITSRVLEPELLYDEKNNSYELRISALLSNQYKITFAQDVEYDPDKLRTYLGYDRFSSEELVIQEEERKLREFYEEHGFKNPLIDTEESFIDNQRKIKFRITLVEQIEIDDINFLGNHTIDSDTLEDVIDRYYDQSELEAYYSEKNIAGLLEALTDFYKQEGFQDVSIQVTDSTIDDDEADLTLTIEEGKRIIVKEINFMFVDTKSPVNDKELLELLSYKIGDPFNFYKFQDSSSRLKSYFQDKGFPEITIREQVHFEDSNKAIIKYSVSLGEQALIGLIRIQGNKKINERRIRERIILPFGEPLNSKKLFEVKKVLYKMGLFKNVEIIDEGKIPDTHYHNLVIIVDELNTRSVEFGPGFATLNREGVSLFQNNIVRGFAGFTHKNIDGEAKSLSLRGSVQRRIPDADITERKVSAGLRQPNIFYTEVNTGINYVNARTDKVEFDVDENTLVLSADRDITEKIKGTLHYTFEFIDTFNIVSATEDTGLLRLGSISVGLERFDVDNRLNPRTGIINSVKFSLYNHYFVSEEEFYTAIGRTDFLYEIYKNFNFHISLRGGYGRTYSDTADIPIEKRFFLGGTGTIRGFKEDFVGTPETFLNGSPIGGRMYINYVGEFLFPIYHEFRGAIFSDGGNLYQDESNFDITNIRQSAGPGLRYDTPVGPIKTDFGFKLDRQENESIGEFHFSIGFIW